jgi:peptide/nickel transport system permease protein
MKTAARHMGEALPIPIAMPLSERLGVAFWLAVMWLALVVFLAAGAGMWPLPEPDRMDWTVPAAPPGTTSLGPAEEAEGVRALYLFGTDTMGRDILARLVFGARVSLAVGLITPLIGLLAGGGLGLLAGFYRGRLESVLATAMDTVLAFPGLVLLLAVTFYLGPGLANMIIALGILTIPAFFRVARANTLALAGREFVLAARILGQGDGHILLREILPNLFMPLVVYALLMVSYMIVAEGAMSFLGLGVPPPTPSWGGMIAEGREMLQTAPHVSLIPASVMFLTVLSFNLMGDALRGLSDRREGQL